MANDKLVLTGKVSGIFGTRGWVKLFSYTRPRRNLLTYKTLLIGPQHIAYQIQDSKEHGNRLIALFSGIDNREQAASFVEQEIFIQRQWLTPERDGEFYWADLIGLKVLNTYGVDLGCVHRLHETGANDVLELNSTPPRLIPFVMHTHIVSVDLEKGLIIVDWHPDD